MQPVVQPAVQPGCTTGCKSVYSRSVTII